MPSGEDVQSALAASEAELRQVEQELKSFQFRQNTDGSAQRYGRLVERQESLAEQIRRLRKEVADAHL